MAFVLAEEEHLRAFEEQALKELVAAADDEVTQDQIDAIGQFCDLVRERRTRFAGHIAGRKARLAAIVK
jgi:hypothetical protein